MGGTYYGKENEYDVSAGRDDHRERSRDPGTGRGGKGVSDIFLFRAIAYENVA